MKSVKVQVVLSKEQEDLKYVQKYIDLGWKPVSTFLLGGKVYFVNLVWDGDEENPPTPN